MSDLSNSSGRPFFSREVELLVVGLGPAGSTALRVLAESGVGVLGVDRAEFPREKPCGGGVSARTLPYLPKGLINLLPHQITQGVSLTLRGKREQVRDFGRPIAYQVRRDQFDQILLEKAREAGALVKTGVCSISLSKKGDRFEARIDGESVLAGAIVAADGATSKVLRDLDPGFKGGSGTKSGVKPWTSAEGWASLRQPIDSRYVAIDLGLVDGGYAWSFPKKDSLWGVGVAGFLRPLKDPRSVFFRYLESRQADPEIEGALTWLIPNFRGAHHGRIPGLFLVGDAGGLVDPFLGEGIYYAILSGTMAAMAYIKNRKEGISGQDLPGRSSRDYVRWVNGCIWPDFRQGSRLAQAIYRFPEFFFDLTCRHPRLLSLYASILTGEHDYRSFSKEIIREAMGKIVPFKSFFAGRTL